MTWLNYLFHNHAFKSYAQLFFKIAKKIEISSWEVLTYGIYARVNLFSQNERASATSE